MSPPKKNEATDAFIKEQSSNKFNFSSSFRTDDQLCCETIVFVIRICFSLSTALTPVIEHSTGTRLTLLFSQMKDSEEYKVKTEEGFTQLSV